MDHGGLVGRACSGRASGVRLVMWLLPVRGQSGVPYWTGASSGSGRRTQSSGSALTNPLIELHSEAIVWAGRALS